jgi:steroid delta-isomerase
MRRLLTAALAVSLAGPCLADVAADEAAIRARLAAWTEAFNAGDAAGACDLFAPDLAYAVPDILHGSHATMCGNLARVLGRADLGVRYEPPAIHEVIVEGDLAVVRLTWTITVTAGGETETTEEEGIDVFRRQPDGRWSIARYIAFPTAPQELIR